MHPANLFEGNIERVVKMAMPQSSDFPQPDETDVIMPEEVRETMTDLCGHVALALRGVEMQGGDLATYIRPAPQSPTLDIRR